MNKITSFIKDALIALITEILAYIAGIFLIFFVCCGLFSKNNGISTFTYWLTAMPFIVGFAIAANVLARPDRKHEKYRFIWVMMALLLMAISGSVLLLYVLKVLK